MAIDRYFNCAICGNSDQNDLFDEGEVIYCSKCRLRTRKDTGTPDLVKCPYCHRPRDRTAYQCRFCHDTNWLPSTKEEFGEIDALLHSYGY